MSYTPNWEDLSYIGKHARVRRTRGKADRCIIFLCHTGSTRFEWANISHRHLDVMDFMPMCKIHHDQYDGVNRSDEARAKLSAAHTGLKESEETRANKSAAQRRRAPISEETRARMSGHVDSEETRARKSAAAKISQLGNQNARGKRSDDSRARMSAAAKAYQARKLGGVS